MLFRPTLTRIRMRRYKAGKRELKLPAIDVRMRLDKAGIHARISMYASDFLMNCL